MERSLCNTKELCGHIANECVGCTSCRLILKCTHWTSGM